MRPALAILAAVLLIAGCGSTASPHSASPSPTASGAGFTVPTKTFNSPAMGVVFRYPASWHLNKRPIWGRNGSSLLKQPNVGSVWLQGTSGSLVVDVLLWRPHDGGQPFPFGDAGSHDLVQARSSQDTKVLHSGLVRVGGLRLASVEVVAPWGTGPRLHSLALSSASAIDVQTIHLSQLMLGVGSPPKHWTAERQTLTAILASMRFTTPQGPK